MSTYTMWTHGQKVDRYVHHVDSGHGKSGQSLYVHLNNMLNMTVDPIKRKANNARYYQKRKLRGNRPKQKRVYGKLLEGFSHPIYERDRARIIYAYRSTCFDCKKVLTSSDNYQLHHDFNSLPVSVLLLCKSCHAKRHNFELIEVK